MPHFMTIVSALLLVPFIGIHVLLYRFHKYSLVKNKKIMVFAFVPILILLYFMVFLLLKTMIS